VRKKGDYGWGGKKSEKGGSPGSVRAAQTVSLSEARSSGEPNGERRLGKEKTVCAPADERSSSRGLDREENHREEPLVIRGNRFVKEGGKHRGPIRKPEPGCVVVAINYGNKATWREGRKQI